MSLRNANAPAISSSICNARRVLSELWNAEAEGRRARYTGTRGKGVRAHLRRFAEDVGIVLLEAPHSREARQGARELVAVQGTKV